MKNDPKIDLGMTGYAELFLTEEQRKEQKLPRILDVPMRFIDEFPNHPFQVRMSKTKLDNSKDSESTEINQADEALESLKNWHDKTGKAFEIDHEASRRRRQGIEGFFMNIPALFNDNLHYRDISKRIIAMISTQSSGQNSPAEQESLDLFQEDVRLIAKDGKLYYLPETQSSGDSSERS